MMDLVLTAGLSNACFSLLLALVAMLVGARGRRPHLAHVLWLFVFVKLVTPPLVMIPVGLFRTPSSVVSTNHGAKDTPIVHAFDVNALPGLTAEAPTIAPLPNANPTTQITSRLPDIRPLMHHGKSWLALLWFVGSVSACVGSLWRVFQFNRLLKTHTTAASRELQTIAAAITKQLKLRRTPEIVTTSARVSPLVWWTGGRVRVVIPASLLEQMEPDAWRWVLAHELAHVKRRDYLIRWLEWLACVCFWWNPVVWWAQRNLRATEEICCDALVLSCLKPTAHAYADSLLTAVEFLARPAFRLPAMASEINSGGFLERRFRMIISETASRRSSRGSQACVLLCAMVVLPLGLAYAKDGGAVAEQSEQVKTDAQMPKQAGAASVVPKKAMAEEDENQKERRLRFEETWARFQADVERGVLPGNSLVLVRMAALVQDNEEYRANLDRLQQECKRCGVEVTEQEVQDEIRRMAGQNMSVKRFLNGLKWASKCTPEVFANQVVWPFLALQKLAKGQLVVTQEEIEKEFGWNYGSRVEILPILCRNRQHAEDVRARLKADPASFERIAKEESIAVEPVKPCQIPHSSEAPLLERAAFAMKDGEISEIIGAKGHYLILRCERHIEPTSTTLTDEIRGDLKQAILERKLRKMGPQITLQLKEYVVGKEIGEKYENKYERLGRAWAKLQAAVESGEMSKEDAYAKMTLLRRNDEETQLEHNLLEQECKRCGMEVTEQEIRDEIARIAMRTGSSVDAWLEQIQEQHGIDPDSYSNQIIWPRLVLKKLAKSQLAVTQDEIEKEFERKYGPRVAVQIIVCRSGRHAENAHAQLKADPASFEKIAKEESLDGNLAAMARTVCHGDKSQDIEHTAFALKEGEISKAFIDEESGNYLILRCEEQIPATQSVLTEKIRADLVWDAQEGKLLHVGGTILSQLKNNAKAKIGSEKKVRDKKG